MKERMTRSYRLTKELSQLFCLEGKFDSTLSVSMYYLNKILESERSSIFLFQHLKQELTVFSSLDLEKHEISIPKTCGVAGWVFVNRKPCIVNEPYKDSRFFKDVDELTGFQTLNLICAPLLDYNDDCLGTLQSLNKNSGDFTTDDLDLLCLAANLMTVEIKKNKRYADIFEQNDTRREFIKQISNGIGDCCN